MQKQAHYALTLATLTWFGVIMVSSQFGILNFDEPWYLTASHLILAGQFPYRDFAYTQTPLLPYLYGPVIWLLGANIAIGRFISASLALLTFALALNIAHKLAGPRAAILAFVLLVVTPSVLYYVSIVKTYSLVAALTLLALALVLHSRSTSSALSPLLSTLAAGIAAMVRVSFLPVPILVFLFWALRGRWKASGLSLLVLASVALVFAANSNGNFLFDIFEFHQRVTLPQYASSDNPKLTLALATAFAFAPGLYSAVYLLVIGTAFRATRTRLAGWSRIQASEKMLFVLVTASLWIVHFAAPGNYLEYQVPGYFLLVILLAAVAAQSTHAKNRLIPIAVFAICAIASSVPAWVTSAKFKWQPTSFLAAVNKQSVALAHASKQGDTLLGQFNHLGLAAGVNTYPGNEMGMFSVSIELSLPETASRHLLSEDAVTNALLGCSATFVATDSETPFDRSVPSTAPIPAITQHRWAELLDQNYRAIYSDSEVTIYRRSSESCTAVRLQ